VSKEIVMHKRILSAVLAVLTINLVSHAQAGVGAKPKDVQAADKIFSTVVRLGVDANRLVKVTLRDGSELTGYIREINNDDFVLVGDETGTVHKLTYAQVKQVKPYQSRGRKVGSVIGYVAIFGIIVAMSIGYMRK
jgi:thymidine phosphorylase